MEVTPALRQTIICVIGKLTKECRITTFAKQIVLQTRPAGFGFKNCAMFESKIAPKCDSHVELKSYIKNKGDILLSQAPVPIGTFSKTLTF